MNKIKQVLQTAQGTVPTIQELSDEYRRLYEKDLSVVESSVNRKLYRQVRKIESELSVILNEIIIGNEDVDISALIKTINARNWIETGIEYLKKTGNICPFCQQETIDEKLTKQFNELFDETYKKKIEQISSLLTQYKKNTSNFISNILAIQSDYNQDNITSNLYLKLQKLFDSNYTIIEEKIKNSNERKSISSIFTLKPELSKLIEAVKENNKTFSELDDKRKILITNIWEYMADSCKDQIDIFRNKENKYSRINSLVDVLLDVYKNNIITSKATIESLRNQTVNTKEAVDNINLILKNSGFESFEIAEKDTVNNISQYYLKRPNDTVVNPIFKSLSEGEKSFISL